MGWSSGPDLATSPTDQKSFNGVTFKNVLAKTRKEKGKESELQVGNDIANIEAVRFVNCTSSVQNALAFMWQRRCF